MHIVGQGSGTIIAWDDRVKASIDAPLLFSSKVDGILLEGFKLLCNIDQGSASNDLRDDRMGLFLDCGGDPLAGVPAECNDIVMRSLGVAYCSNRMHIKGGASPVTAADLDLHHNGMLWNRSTSCRGIRRSPGSFARRSGRNADPGVHLDVVENVRFHDVDVSR